MKPTNENPIPGLEPKQIPTAVEGARMAHEDTPFDEWFHDIFNGKPGEPVRNDFPAKAE